MGVNGDILNILNIKEKFVIYLLLKLYCSILVATNPSVIDSRCTAKNC